MDRPPPVLGKTVMEGPGAMEEADNVASTPGSEGVRVKPIQMVFKLFNSFFNINICCFSNNF